MSDKKRIIKVNDLVIYADNVTFEPRRRHHDRPPFDPFLGPRGQEVEREEEKHEEKVEAVEEEQEEQKENEERPPFSWI